MNDKELQKLVEEISVHDFAKPFRHNARFNSRLRTTGGRYLLRTHDLEFNPLHLQEHGEEELIGIIKHELCHYHLHLEGKGYRHRDQDFIQLLQQVGGARYCSRLNGQKIVLPYRYQLICTDCGFLYKRKKNINPARYVCGRCRGKLRIEPLSQG
ncbi:SprT family protein [Brevibacillus sp. VP]|uniref:SprT family protein n=1 Tax=unclassified Brevibacillus TaxID=2684853 RepID=UPI000E2E4D80|nr:SprT family protein [Brevibacillus sp. VP]RFB28574.1 SprT family protein [Brevibacillus sp. VP]